MVATDGAGESERLHAKFRAERAATAERRQAMIAMDGVGVRVTKGPYAGLSVAERLQAKFRAERAAMAAVREEWKRVRRQKQQAAKTEPPATEPVTPTP